MGDFSERDVLPAYLNPGLVSFRLGLPEKMVGSHFALQEKRLSKIELDESSLQMMEFLHNDCGCDGFHLPPEGTLLIA